MEPVTTARELALATRADDDDSGVARYLNGRLADDRMSRREVARWRLVRLDGVWYDRRRLADALRLAATRRVPHSRRLLTPADELELGDAAYRHR